MAGEVKKVIQLEIGHVLFIDIVGYSKFQGKFFWNKRTSDGYSIYLSAMGRPHEAIEEMTKAQELDPRAKMNRQFGVGLNR
jgi:hypothetical protein